MSDPTLYPAFFTASEMASRAATADSSFGAKPPSSPTAVENPLSLSTFFSE